MVPGDGPVKETFTENVQTSAGEPVDAATNSLQNHPEARTETIKPDISTDELQSSQPPSNTSPAAPVNNQMTAQQDQITADAPQTAHADPQNDQKQRTNATTKSSASPADKQVPPARQHHLLKHTLAEEKRGNNALQHFGTDDVTEAIAKIHGMVQRQLQIHFAKVYGVKSNSNNNSWLRKKLLEAIAPKHMWDLPKPVSREKPTSSHGDTLVAAAALAGIKRPTPTPPAGHTYSNSNMNGGGGHGPRVKRPAAAGVAAATAALRDNSDDYTAAALAYNRTNSSSGGYTSATTAQAGWHSYHTAAAGTGMNNNDNAAWQQRLGQVSAAAAAAAPLNNNNTVVANNNQSSPSELMQALISLHGLLNAAQQQQQPPQQQFGYGSFGGQKPGSSFAPPPPAPPPVVTRPEPVVVSAPPPLSVVQQPHIGPSVAEASPFASAFDNTTNAPSPIAIVQNLQQEQSRSSLQATNTNTNTVTTVNNLHRAGSSEDTMQRQGSGFQSFQQVTAAAAQQQQAAAIKHTEALSLGLQHRPIEADAAKATAAVNGGYGDYVVPGSTYQASSLLLSLLRQHAGNRGPGQ